jgi:hypothetical protein
MEILMVVLAGRTRKAVSVKQIGKDLFKVTKGSSFGQDEDANGDLVLYVEGRTQAVIAPNMLDACIQAQHLVRTYAI